MVRLGPGTDSRLGRRSLTGIPGVTYALALKGHPVIRSTNRRPHTEHPPHPVMHAAGPDPYGDLPLVPDMGLWRDMEIGHGLNSRRERGSPLSPAERN